MHGSVLTNKKYIKFAEANTVEVISMGKIDVGRQRKDKRLETYRGKDGKEYLAGWPNLTLAELEDLNKSKARSYNDTRGIPYTAVVDPHTEEKLDFISGGYASGALMDKVVAVRKQLDKTHGKGVTRKTLAKVRKAETKISELLEAGKIPQALADAIKLEKSMANKPVTLQEMAAKIKAGALEAAGKRLDELEALIGRGEVKVAKRELGSLGRALKGTDLEQRALDLLARTKETS